ncbi:MAG: TlpA disulfide reductase family protein [Verrucomicrobiota bacterium]
MKTIHTFLLVFATALTVSSYAKDTPEKAEHSAKTQDSAATSTDSVKAIITDIEKEKITKLTAYLKANPEAEDRLDGLSFLITAYLNLENNEQAIPVLKEKYQLLTNGKKIADIDLITLLPDTVQPLTLSLTSTGSREEAKTFIAKVREDLSAHPMAQQIDQFLEQTTAEINAPNKGDILEIAFTSLTGEKVDLAAMKGKVVLLDFWATWCGPCVAELPNLLDTYNKHHDKGFEIIGISLDQDGDTLKSFIKENNIPWAQYFDGKGWGNSIAQKYSIKALPATFLIGKNGKVMTRNLHGSRLDEEVTRLLSEK